MKTSHPTPVTVLRRNSAAIDISRRRSNARMDAQTHVRGYMLWLASVTAMIASLTPRPMAAGISLETAPPVVVRTSPVAGATDVNPALTELRVTYSKPMQDGSWSWSTWGEEKFPEMDGQPRYLADGRTCVLTVKLEPGEFYATWLNSDKFKNFKDRDGRPAVPYLLTFRTAEAGGSGSDSSDQATLGPVMETVLKAPEGRIAELLDLDTGRRATSRNFGENDRKTHAWIRENKLETLGVVEKGQIAVLCNDMAVLPVKSELWEQAAAADVLKDKWLAQMEPNTITGISPATEKTDTWFFRTREDGHGILQIVSQSDSPLGVKIRYKLVQGASSRSSAAGDPVSTSTAFTQVLNDDQRAVIAWTDRQFHSYFDNRSFDGWTDEEIRVLEAKCIDALSGPRSRDYYTAINTLEALHSTNGLARLRELAFQRVDRNNRDRWMSVRVLATLDDTQSIPDLIHLVYHGNPNTHWWAQIALVQLTGQNFGGDWEAWGEWWNADGGQPAYNAEIIRWWEGQADTVDGLRETLADGDRRFLESVN